MAVTAQIAPFTRDQIIGVLRTSTAGAVKTCTGGPNGRACGFRWSVGTFDGSLGAGQQMSVLGALTSLLLDFSSGPVTSSSGGTSQGDPNAGGNPNPIKPPKPITQADRAGAGILTALILGLAVAACFWMSSDISEK